MLGEKAERRSAAPISSATEWKRFLKISRRVGSKFIGAPDGKLCFRIRRRRHASPGADMTWRHIRRSPRGPRSDYPDGAGRDRKKQWPAGGRRTALFCWRRELGGRTSRLAFAAGDRSWASLP